VDEGTLVSTGKSLLNIIEIDRIKAHIQVIERDYRFLKEGQKVEISTDAYPGEVFEGVISNVSNILSENTRNALVVISIDNHDYRLRPGMFVRARVVFSEHKNAQVVPHNAILTYEKTQGVLCYDKATESAKFYPVKIGLSNRTQVEILSPKLDMPVVTVGNHLLQNGRKITVSQLSRKQIVESMRETKPDDSKNAEKK